MKKLTQRKSGEAEEARRPSSRRMRDAAMGLVGMVLAFTIAGIPVSGTADPSVSTGSPKARKTVRPSLSEIIQQKPLSGELSPLRLALNQPFQSWAKLLGNGRRVEAETDDDIAFTFGAGRFVVTVNFTGTAKLGTSVAISSRQGEPELTLEEATQVMRSLGLTSAQRIAQDANFDIEPTEDERSWGQLPSDPDHPETGSPISAVFRPKNIDNTGSERVLSITTRLIFAH